MWHITLMGISSLREFFVVQLENLYQYENFMKIQEGGGGWVVSTLVLRAIIVWAKAFQPHQAAEMVLPLLSGVKLSMLPKTLASISLFKGSTEGATWVRWLPLKSCLHLK